MVGQDVNPLKGLWCESRLHTLADFLMKIKKISSFQDSLKTPICQNKDALLEGTADEDPVMCMILHPELWIQNVDVVQLLSFK